MRFVLIALLSFSFAPAAFAQAQPGGTVAAAPGAIAGGKVVSFDGSKKVLEVEANGQRTKLDVTSAVVSGNIAVGALVDVTFANGKASAVSVRGAPGQGAPQGGQQAATGGTAVAGGAISGAKVIAFDAAKKMMTVDAGGQKIDINVANAVVNGTIVVGKVVDVSHANGAASAVNVRP